jgi:hypothetical protein
VLQAFVKWLELGLPYLLILLSIFVWQHFIGRRQWLSTDSPLVLFSRCRHAEETYAPAAKGCTASRGFKTP